MAEARCGASDHDAAENIRAFICPITLEVMSDPVILLGAYRYTTAVPPPSLSHFGIEKENDRSTLIQSLFDAPPLAIIPLVLPFAL